MGGVKGFYHGVGANLIRGIAVGSTYLSSYESSKHAIIRRGYADDGLALQFGASIISGFVVSLASIPFDNIRTRMFTQGTTAMTTMKGDNGLPTQYKNLFDCAYKMMRYEGPVSFMRGFSGSWMRFAPLTSI